MQACLNSEPQVAVTRHLLEQAPDAVMIPEEVRIELMLVDLSREFSLDVDGDGSAPIQRDRVPVATVFTLNRSSVKSWVGCAVDRLPAARVQLPQRFEPNRQLMLFTIIHVYGDHLLRDYESGLTCPRYFAFDGAIEPGDVVQFQYALGQNPGLRTSMAGATDSVASTSSKTVSSG